MSVARCCSNGRSSNDEWNRKYPSTFGDCFYNTRDYFGECIQRAFGSSETSRTASDGKTDSCRHCASAGFNSDNAQDSRTDPTSQTAGWSE